MDDRSSQPGQLRELFEEAHETRYGYRDQTAGIELVTVRRRYLTAGVRPELETPDFEGAEGPVSINLDQATLYLPEGWNARAEKGGLLGISHKKAM